MKKLISFVVAAVAAGSCFATSVDDVTNNLKPQDNYPGAERPVFGSAAGDTHFVSEGDLQRKSNSSYPAWYRGNGENGKADADSLYSYVEIAGPFNNPIATENIYMGTLILKPGATYPAHNHGANEMYYIISGEADWWVNDQKQPVKAGDTIYHKPFDVHGWVNTSATEELHAVYMWWKEPGDPDDLFNHGARFVNPELFESEGDALPHAQPMPKPATPLKK
ncbi:hypothetical protein SIN8267_01297 [Sinobacterium norvegicum]|uniref:Cupin type-2 domain-containing protein n=1 Tax=Sinobacterium norvegicum TaxID=1641715 RepID=A0ABM9ADT0_9GAMM|nr:dimethylsulfonioproprionate lyase family protein [Sinobacterium norvegicum]CAH0991195.1 hypothetical protein SIN8267_01297 [Sinobacterium norvegicum]